MVNEDEVEGLCPSWALSVGYLGVASAAVLSNWGSAWGTWKSGVSLIHTGIRHPESVMKNVIPVVMAGVIGIYGLIVAVILAEAIGSPEDSRVNTYSIYTAMAHLAAGLCCGCSGLVAGGCIGIVGDYGVRSCGYRASNITLFPSMDTKARQDVGYSKVADSETSAQEDVSGSDDQNKLFVGMLIMLIFSEALALYGLIVALIVSQKTYECGSNI